MSFSTVLGFNCISPCQVSLFLRIQLRCLQENTAQRNPSVLACSFLYVKNAVVTEYHGSKCYRNSVFFLLTICKQCIFHNLIECFLQLVCICGCKFHAFMIQIRFSILGIILSLRWQTCVYLKKKFLPNFSSVIWNHLRLKLYEVSHLFSDFHKN